MTLDMLRTGEMTGNLDLMLNKSAQHYEEEGKLKSHQIAMIFSLGVLLIVAVLIGIQVIAFYSGYGAGVSNAAS